MDLMSTAQLLGNFGEFVGAIGVVGTLIYLAVQVRQSKEALDANTKALDENRTLTRADTVRGATSQWSEITYRISQNRDSASVFLRGNENLFNLDDVDQLTYACQLTQFLNFHVACTQMARDGFLDQEFIALVEQTLGDMLREHPGAQTWWDTAQPSYPDRDRINASIQSDSGGRSPIGSPFVAQPTQA